MEKARSLGTEFEGVRANLRAIGAIAGAISIDTTPPGETTESTTIGWEMQRNFSSSYKPKDFKTAYQEALRPTGHSHFQDPNQLLTSH